MRKVEICRQCHQVPDEYFVTSCRHHLCLHCASLHTNGVVKCSVCGASTEVHPETLEFLQSFMKPQLTRIASANSLGSVTISISQKAKYVSETPKNSSPPKARRNNWLKPDSCYPKQNFIGSVSLSKPSKWTANSKPIKRESSPMRRDFSNFVQSVGPRKILAPWVGSKMFCSRQANAKLNQPSTSSSLKHSRSSLYKVFSQLLQPKIILLKLQAPSLILSFKTTEQIIWRGEGRKDDLNFRLSHAFNKSISSLDLFEAPQFQENLQDFSPNLAKSSFSLFEIRLMNENLKLEEQIESAHIHTNYKRFGGESISRPLRDSMKPIISPRRDDVTKQKKFQTTIEKTIKEEENKIQPETISRAKVLKIFEGIENEIQEKKLLLLRQIDEEEKRHLGPSLSLSVSQNMPQVKLSFDRPLYRRSEQSDQDSVARSRDIMGSPQRVKKCFSNRRINAILSDLQNISRIIREIEVHPLSRISFGQNFALKNENIFNTDRDLKASANQSLNEFQRAINSIPHKTISQV